MEEQKTNTKDQVFWTGLGCTLKKVDFAITVHDNVIDRDLDFGVAWSPEHIYRALSNLRKGWIQR